MFDLIPGIRNECLETATHVCLFIFRIITSDISPIDEPLVYVVSEGTGSVSLYQIVDQAATLPAGK